MTFGGMAPWAVVLVVTDKSNEHVEFNVLFGSDDPVPLREVRIEPSVSSATCEPPCDGTPHHQPIKWLWGPSQEPWMTA